MFYFILFISGACESDYPNTDIDIHTNTEVSIEGSNDPNKNDQNGTIENNKTEEQQDNEDNKNESKKIETDGTIGKIMFVSCATGSEDTSTLPPAAPPPESSPEPMDTNANGN